MKHSVNDVKRHSGLVLLFAAVVAISAASIMPQAMADTPNQSLLPDPPIVNNPVTITIEGKAPQAPHFGERIRVMEPGWTSGGGLAAPCTALSIAAPNSYSVWELQSGGSPVTYTLQAGDQLKITFGSGGAPTVTLINTSGNSAVTAGPYTWVDVGVGGGVHNTSQLAAYTYGSCGKDGNQAGNNFQQTDEFTPVKPVGGEIIPISTTALLLAGMSTSALWLVPLAAVAVGAFTVLRLQVNRK